MAFFLFHTRLARLTGFTGKRARVFPDLMSKYGLVRTVVTKTKGNSNTLLIGWRPPWNPKLLSDVKEFSSKSSSMKSRILQGFRYFCLAGGVVFWSCVAVSLTLSATGLLTFGIEEETVQLKHTNPQMAKHIASMFQLYDDPEDLLDVTTLMEDKKDEYALKRAAYNSTWKKLSNEEGFRTKFGDEVLVIGYNRQEVSLIEARDRTGKENVHKNEDRWKVCVFIVGSKVSGLVTMEFHKVTKGEIKWVPVSLSVEEIPRSGIKICDVSAPLPNGVSKFTRFMNDDL